MTDTAAATGLVFHNAKSVNAVRCRQESSRAPCGA